MPTFIDQDTLRAFVRCLAETFDRPATLYLVGETSLVFEGWLRWTDEILYCADVEAAHRPAFDAAVEQVAEDLGAAVFAEDPGDLIPLPEGHAARHRPADTAFLNGSAGRLRVLHFDPYSVAFRHIARGDETDYHLVLAYRENGWLTLEEMDRLLEELLPRFSMETIAQDPAEFRRKYKGLGQMAEAISPGTLHRHTPA